MSSCPKCGYPDRPKPCKGIYTPGEYCPGCGYLRAVRCGYCGRKLKPSQPRMRCIGNGKSVFFHNMCFLAAHGGNSNEARLARGLPSTHAKPPKPRPRKLPLEKR